MRDLLLQRWATMRGLATGPGGGGVTSITQDGESYLQMAGYADIAFLIDVVDLTLPTSATITLTIESAPTVDENLFQAIAPPIVFDGVDVTASANPIQLKAVRTPSTVALAPIVRWRINVSAGATGTWGLTFRIRAIPGRSRFFVPTDIAGNVAWFRSDMGITKAASPGNQVSEWADQSGLGHDLTSSGGNRPTWIASSINGRPALFFNPTGAPQFMATSAFALGTYTVLMVTTGQDPASTVGWFWTRGPAGGAGVADTLYGTISATIYSTRAGTTSARDLTTPPTNWGRFGASTAAVLTVLMDGTHAGHRLRINGIEQTLTSGSPGDPGTGTTSDAFSIAASSDAVLPSNIKVAEVIVYDRALSSDELAIVEEYLNRRYGLY